MRDDVDALDELAQAAYDGLRGNLELEAMIHLRPAIRSRVLRLAALDAGAIDSELFHVHVTALVDLVAGDLHGEVQLPGHVTAYRDRDHLFFRSTPVSR